MTVVEDRLAEPRDATTFLRELADRSRAPIPAADVAIVVAHPDDETIGCGAQLRRLLGAKLIFVTDGAPHNSDDARSHGFSSSDAYASARARELGAVLAQVDVPERNVIKLGFFDQAAALQLTDLTRTIYCLLSAHGVRIVLTHAYEGGHPDHDAAAFAVHATAALARRGGSTVAVVEMPFYRAEGARAVMQRFDRRSDRPICTIRLKRHERKLKRRMMEAYATQRQTLAPFGVWTEQFRPAPDYDFTRLPNEGCLLYERYPWGVTGERWLGLVRDALGELRLGQGR